MPKAKAKPSNILSQLEVCCPIVCATPSCAKCSSVLSNPVMPADEHDSFYENYLGDGVHHEGDKCKVCKEWGLLEDPMNLLLYTVFGDGINPQTDRYMAMQFTPELIDALVGLLNNFNEGKPKAAESTFGTDAAGFDYSPNIHIYNTEEFGGDEFDFQGKRDFDEANKMLVCSNQGVCFQVEYRERGASEDEGIVIRTCWFNMTDLLALREWLKENGLD